MSFRSFKTVPTTSGCVSESGNPEGQIVFSSLEKLMAYGWKSAKFKIEINGSFRINRIIPVVGINSITYVDFGEDDAIAPNGPSNMSDFVCEQRLGGQHTAVAQYTDSNAPNEIFTAEMYLNTEYEFAYKSGEYFWFANHNFTFIEITTDVYTEEVGELFIDGERASSLYYDGRYDDVFTFTLLDPFVVNITTIGENVAD